MDHSCDVDKIKAQQFCSIKQQQHEHQHCDTTYLVTNHKLTDNTGASGRYTGSLDKKTEKPHGEGRMECASHIYQGQWIDGDRSGFGTLKNLQTGDVYEGGFFDNMRHGQGVLAFPDGHKYDGTFSMDEMGKGTMTYLDGTTFWGYCDDKGVPNGRGKYSYTNGSVYDGEFIHGIIEGHGKMTWSDGRWYLGEWCNGQKNGLGIEVLPDGSLFHKGIFCNGEPITSSSFPKVERKRRRRLSLRGKETSSSQLLVFPCLSHGCPNDTLVGPIPRRLNMRNLILLKINRF